MKAKNIMIRLFCLTVFIIAFCLPASSALSAPENPGAGQNNPTQSKKQTPPELEQGLEPGAQIPFDFSLSDQSGVPKNLSDISGPEGVILIFSRSTSWCPYCIDQIKLWDTQISRFAELGYQIATLTYDPVTQQRSFAAKHDISYPVLSDQGSSLISAFGLLNEKYPKDSSYYGIPHPAIYVITPEGEITHRFAYQGYEIRPSPDLVHNALSESQTRKRPE